MAIQVGGTTVISNNREVSNVSGFKTVGGSSILGSGDIGTGGAPASFNSFTWATKNSGNTQRNYTLNAVSTGDKLVIFRRKGGNINGASSSGGIYTANANTVYFSVTTSSEGFTWFLNFGQ